MDRIFQFFAPGFDAWVLEVVLSLLNGLELVVGEIQPAGMECDELLDWLDRHGVDFLMTTPSYLATGMPRPRPALRTVAVVGEASSPALVRRWLPEHQLLNLYGPTETTIAATGAFLDGNGERVPIGWPLDHIDLYVLDHAGRPVPQGESGEISRRGVGRRPRLRQPAGRDLVRLRRRSVRIAASHHVPHRRSRLPAWRRSS